MSPQKGIVEQCFRKRASGSGVQQLQCGGKPVYGESSMGTTMKTKNSGEGNQWSQCVQRRYVQKASLPDITAVQGVSSLSGDSKTAHHSPA